MLDAELQLFKQDATTNRLSDDRVISGVVNNVWPHISKAQRASGLTEWEKLFHKVSNDADETLLSAIHYMDVGCRGDSYMFWAPATQREDVDDWATSPPSRYYGEAGIKTDVTAGTSTVTVTVKHTDQTTMFQNGDVFFITDKSAPDSSSGNTEQKTINAAPTVSGLDVTITVDSNFSNGYLVADSARCMSAPAAADLECTVDNYVDASSIYDETTYPIITDNIGTPEETVTVSFPADGTNFTVSGDTVGNMGSGDKNTDFTWTNPDWSKPGFTIDKDGWGTPAAGDTFSFQLHPAAYPMGFKKVTPVAATSRASELHRQAITGESP